MPSSAASEPIRSCSAASQTIADGSASARIERSSCAVYAGLSGTACAPAARIAKVATAASIEFAMISATRPPRTSPPSAWANPATQETYSRYVSRSSPQRSATRSGAASPAAASMCSTVGKICGIAGVMVPKSCTQGHGRLRGPRAASRSQVLSVTPRSRNLYFCTLPLSVLGSSLTNSR